MPERPPFVLGDATVVVMAASAAAGALVGGGPGRAAAVVLAVVAVAIRRPALLCLAVAVLAAALADRAMAGLDPVTPGPVRAWVTLVTDPARLDSGGVAADVRVEGRRVEAHAFGAAAAALADRLAGERVEVVGRLRPPPDDAPWLVARRVVGRLAVEEAGAWAPGSGATRAANGLRRTMAEGAAGLPRASRSLLAGVVLGDDREQPAEVADDFRAAGLAHLLAVSGANVAFVIAVAGPLLTRLRWRTRLPVTVAVLAGFALLVRFEPSVLRAVAMAGVAALAAALGRPAAGIRILGLAVTVLLLVDPLLARSVGFGLSVAASGSILVVAPILRRRLPGPVWVAEPLAVTLAAQAGTLPLLVATFGGLPLASVPANLLAVPAAGPLMVWGLTAGVVAGLGPAVSATVLHGPTSVLTWWLATVARWAAALPLGELRRGHAVGLAVAATAWWFLRHRGRRSRRVTVVAVLVVLAVAAAGRPRLPEGSTALGDSTLWSAGGSTVLVVDGRVGAERTLEALRRAGSRCVDVVAVAGGGRPAAVLATALLRRCRGAVAVAPAGRAHPGWLALSPGRPVSVGRLVVAVDAEGGLAVRAAAPDPRPGGP